MKFSGIAGLVTVFGLVVVLAAAFQDELRMVTFGH